MITQELLEQQLLLEEEMRHATIDRYFKNHEKAEDRGEFADTHAGRNIMPHVLDSFVAGIEEWCEGLRSGKAGRRPRALHMIDGFGDNRKMAFIFIKQLMNVIPMLERDSVRSPAAKRTSVALMATQGIHDELTISHFNDNRKKLLKAILKDFKARDVNRPRRRQLLQRTFKAQQINWVAEGWSQAERLNLGVVLIDIFRKSTGMIHEETSFDRQGRTIVSIQITDEFSSMLMDRMTKVANMFTLFYPTVIPPKQWMNGELIGGGYYTSNIAPYRLIKGSKAKYISEMENRDLSAIIDPINALQNTPWKVNPVMVDMLRHVFDNGISVTGLTTADHKELPDRPDAYGSDDDITREYKKTCYIIHDENRRNISKRLAVLRTLTLADKFSKFEAIYFPHDLDSRGRAYPRPTFLSPQGADYSKGLLEFAGGKTIETEDDIMFLAIAGANAWGQDKLPLHERYMWVMDNQDMLLDIADDPKADLRWTKADEPFMALRFCLEWKGLAEAGVGVFKSSMPVHFDATCSGLQHFSAILRDAEGGKHVNLTNSGQREDIYGEVARKATASITALLDSDEFGVAAGIALEIGVTRGLCKRPVMIVPYAGTFSSCMQYVNDYYREMSEEGVDLPLPLDEIRQVVSAFVAKHIWAAISDTVIAAREAMNWITATAKLACADKQSTPLQWTTPDGFLVQQAKYKESESRIKTYLDGERTIRSTIYTSTNELDARQNAQSLSPNYIHSMDACHLRKSICMATSTERDISFAMIHDSFGCHASDMKWFLAACIKPAFVEMYEGGNNLELFRDELSVNVAEDKRGSIQSLPAMGTLDLNDVLESEFFFS